MIILFACVHVLFFYTDLSNSLEYRNNRLPSSYCIFALDYSGLFYIYLFYTKWYNTFKTKFELSQYFLNKGFFMSKAIAQCII